VVGNSEVYIEGLAGFLEEKETDSKLLWTQSYHHRDHGDEQDTGMVNKWVLNIWKKLYGTGKKQTQRKDNFC
jgi:hypothetical protein